MKCSLVQYSIALKKFKKHYCSLLVTWIRVLDSSTFGSIAIIISDTIQEPIVLVHQWNLCNFGNVVYSQWLKNEKKNQRINSVYIYIL